MSQYIDVLSQLGIERYGLDPDLPYAIFVWKTLSHIALDPHFTTPVLIVRNGVVVSAMRPAWHPN